VSTAAAAGPTPERRTRGRARSSAAALASPAGLWGLLVVWSLLPLAAVEVYAARHGGHATGALSSLVVEDQFQYLAWIRESGSHVAISNLFDTGPAEHVFLYPPFLISGALWRLGLPLAVTYHLWTLLGAGLLVAAVTAYARRSFGSSGWRSAVVLAIVFGTPMSIVGIWIATASAGGDRLLAYVISPLSAFWGYGPRLLSVALMPAFLLAVEAVLVPARRWRGWSRTRWLAIASVLGLAVSWIHPWQGLVLVLVLVGLAAWERFDRRSLILAVPAALTAAPLLYYAILHQSSADWQRAAQNPNYFSLLDVFLVLVPFVALALVGVRRPGDDVHERALLLWPVAAAVAFAAPTGGRFEVVAGLSIPLAILIVRGWRRMGVPRPITVVAMVAMLLGGTVPLLADLPGNVTGGAGTLWLRDGDRAALRSIEQAPSAGSVLADSHVAAATVALTGRRMWAAHANWSPDYVQRATAINAAIAGRLRRPDVERLLALTGARFVFLDCERGASAALVRQLDGLVRSQRRFGCAQVLEIAR
jgi:hypothetical protein